MGNLAYVKTTLDIHDALLARAKRYARNTGRPFARCRGGGPADHALVRLIEATIPAA